MSSLPRSTGSFKRLRVVRLVSQLFRRLRPPHTPKTFTLPSFTVSSPYPPVAGHFSTMSLILHCRYLRATNHPPADESVASSLLSSADDVFRDIDSGLPDDPLGPPFCEENEEFGNIYRRTQSHDSIFQQQDFRPRKMIRASRGLDGRFDRNSIAMSSGNGSSLMDITNAALRSELESKMFVRAKRLNSGTNDPANSSRVRADSAPFAGASSTYNSTASMVSYLSNGDLTQQPPQRTTVSTTRTTTQNYSSLIRTDNSGQESPFQVILPAPGSVLSHEAAKHRIAIKPKNRRPKSFQPTHGSFEISDFSDATFNRKFPTSSSTGPLASVLSEVQATYEIISQLPEPFHTQPRQPAASSSSSAVMQDQTARKTAASTMTYSKSFHLPRRPSAEFSSPQRSPRLSRLLIASAGAAEGAAQPPPVPPKLFHATTTDDFQKAFSRVRRHVEPAAGTLEPLNWQESGLSGATLAPPASTSTLTSALPVKSAAVKDTGSDLDSERWERELKAATSSLLESTVSTSSSTLPSSLPSKSTYLAKDGGRAITSRRRSRDEVEAADSLHESLVSSMAPSSVPIAIPAKSAFATSGTLRDLNSRRWSREVTEASTESLHRSTESSTTGLAGNAIPSSLPSTFPLKSSFPTKAIERDINSKRWSRDVTESIADSLQRLHETSTSNMASVSLATSYPLSSAFTSKDYTGSDFSNKRGSRDVTAGSRLHESTNIAPAPFAFLQKTVKETEPASDLINKRGSRDITEPAAESPHVPETATTTTVAPAPFAFLQKTVLPLNDVTADLGTKRGSRDVTEPASEPLPDSTVSRSRTGSSSRIPVRPTPFVPFSYSKTRPIVDRLVSRETEIPAHVEPVPPPRSMFVTHNYTENTTVPVAKAETPLSEIEPDKAVEEASAVKPKPNASPKPVMRTRNGNSISSLTNSSGEEELLKVLARRHATLDVEMASSGTPPEMPPAFTSSPAPATRSDSFKENDVAGIRRKEFGSRRSVFSDVPSSQQPRETNSELPPPRKHSIDKENQPIPESPPIRAAEPVLPIRRSSMLRRDFFRDTEEEIKRLENPASHPQPFRSIFLDPPANFPTEQLPVPVPAPVPEKSVEKVETSGNTHKFDRNLSQGSAGHQNDENSHPTSVHSRAAMFQQKVADFKPLSPRNSIDMGLNRTPLVAPPVRVALKTKQAPATEDSVKPALEPVSPPIIPHHGVVRAEELASSPPSAWTSTVPPVPLKQPVTTPLPKPRVNPVSVQVSCGSLTSTVPAWVALAQEKRKRIGLLTGKVEVDPEGAPPVC